MEKLKKYKKQIFTFITIFLLLEFGVFPCLTMANTFANIIGAIALLVLVLWAGLELYDYVKSSDGFVDKKEISEAEQKWKEHLEKVQSEIKANTKSTVKIDVSDAKDMNEIAGIVNPISEGRVKISVENPKPKRKYTKKTK